MSGVVVDLAVFREKTRGPVESLAGSPSMVAGVPVACVDALHYGGTGESSTGTGAIRVTGAGYARSYQQIQDAWLTVALAHRAGLRVADLDPLIASVTWVHIGGTSETILNARLAGVAS